MTTMAANIIGISTNSTTLHSHVGGQLFSVLNLPEEPPSLSEHTLFLKQNGSQTKRIGLAVRTSLILVDTLLWVSPHPHILLHHHGLSDVSRIRRKFAQLLDHAKEASHITHICQCWCLYNGRDFDRVGPNSTTVSDVSDL